MSTVIIIGYLLPIIFSVAVILTATEAINEDASLSVRGNVGTAFVAAAGFTVFPVLNVPAAIWLLYELSKHRRTPAKKATHQEPEK